MLPKGFGLACFLALLAPAANADVIYQYTGNPFTIFNPTVGNPYTGSDFVSVSLTLADKLAPNLTLSPLEYGVDTNFITFNFSDGLHSISPPLATVNGTSIDPTLYVSTDASGNVVGPWAMFEDAADQQKGTFDAPIETTNCAGTNGAGGLCEANFLPQDTGCNSSAMCGESIQSPGTWTTTVVPEPSTLTLSAIGLVLLAAARRERRAYSLSVPLEAPRLRSGRSRFLHRPPQATPRGWFY